MKRAFYWGSAVLQVFLLLTAFGVQWFSVKKMGMMRYVVYISRQWEIQYPIAALRNSVIAFLGFLLVIIALYALVKKDRHTAGKKFIAMTAAGVIATLAFVFFSLLYSTEVFRSYYFICLALAAVALLQDIKIIVCLQKT